MRKCVRRHAADVTGSAPADEAEARRRSGRMTRTLRLLHAHGMIRKAGGTRYYRVTAAGRTTMIPR